MKTTYALLPLLLLAYTTASAAEPNLCENFLYGVCHNNAMCPLNGIHGCYPAPDENCIPSMCECDPATGGLTNCTNDCYPQRPIWAYGICRRNTDPPFPRIPTPTPTPVPTPTPTPSPPADPNDRCANFIYALCRSDWQCPQGGMYACRTAPNPLCISRSCECDPATGGLTNCSSSCFPREIDLSITYGICRRVSDPEFTPTPSPTPVPSATPSSSASSSTPVASATPTPSPQSSTDSVPTAAMNLDEQPDTALTSASSTVEWRWSVVPVLLSVAASWSLRHLLLVA
eukprot:GILJ01008878.1.p1 GENE.GILJ01008878.1~~GILJ01008878.1.p1  ORF type:complete len:287 (+),score=17.73 GILJ01008878.1:86-946(+)